MGYVLDKKPIMPHPALEEAYKRFIRRPYRLWETQWAYDPIAAVRVPDITTIIGSYDSLSGAEIVAANYLSGAGSSPLAITITRAGTWVARLTLNDPTNLDCGCRVERPGIASVS